MSPFSAASFVSRLLTREETMTTRLTLLLCLPAAAAGPLAGGAQADPPMRSPGIPCLAVSQDLKYAVTQNRFHLALWKLGKDQPEWQTWGHDGDGRFVAFTPDGKSILARRGREIHVLERGTGKLRRALALDSTNVRAFALSADGKR